MSRLDGRIMQHIRKPENPPAISRLFEAVDQAVRAGFTGEVRIIVVGSKATRVKTIDEPNPYGK